MKYACLNNISDLGLSRFTKKYTLVEEYDKAQLALVRSQVMHDLEIPKHLIAVARAGAGVNNIPLDKLADAGVVVFNTPGANANAVKELVIAGMFLASRDIVGGVNWVQANTQDPEIAKNVEKAKKAFAGHEILGKTLGVVGLGAVGGKVANAAIHLGMRVIGYDPYLSDEARSHLEEDIQIVTNLEDLYPECDFITLHLPLLDSTKKMINADVFAKLKQGVVLLNFSRDALVDEEAMLTVLEQGKIGKYVTDFPNPIVAGHPGVLAIPHLGASTEESEENCAIMAVDELMDFSETGRIRFSVNYPAIDPGKQETKSRIVVLHGEEDLMNEFMELLFNKPIMNIVSKNKGNRSVTILDIDEEISTECLHKFKEIKGVVKVRLLS